MKRRIRSIFLLMTLCILGINLFQGYWLYNTYALQSRQFSRSVTDALLLTLQQHQEAEAQALFGEVVAGSHPRHDGSGGSGGAGTVVPAPREIYFHFAGPSGTATGGPDADVITLRRFSGELPSLEGMPVDTLARRLSTRVVRNWRSNHPFDLVRLDSLFGLALKRIDIDTPYRLDTLHPARGKAGVPVFETAAPGEYPLRMHPLPVNPVKNLFVQASFAQPVPYVLRQMGWLLAGSLLLGGLTTGCFLYMLATILRQKKLSEIKNDFINNMTHELKTPLATVSAAVEAMQSFGVLDDAAKTQRYLTVSRSQLQRLSDLVDQVLRTAVEEKREMEVQPARVEAAELLGEIVAHHQLKAVKPVVFHVSVPAAGQWVWADRLHLGNAINNLVDNAIKYSGEQVEVRISSRMEGNVWCLSVKDNGIGIAKTYQQAIFERFFRVPTGDLHGVKGFGLGLPYVKGVVEKHGGRVAVTSQPGQGSEFVLWFPGQQWINYQ